MRSYTKMIIIVTSTLNLIFAITDVILNITTVTTLSVFAITNALARTKRKLTVHFTVATGFFSVISMIWVLAKPTGEEYTHSAFIAANNTLCDISQNYPCLIIRTAKEYFLYLVNHWLFCEVLRLLVMTNDVFSKINFGKKSIIMAYVVYNIPAVIYSYLTCDKLSCWDYNHHNVISFWRTVIWILVVFTVMVMFIAVAFLQQNKLPKNIQTTLSLKVIYFFTAMAMMFGIMESLHVTELMLDIMTIESYESIIVALTGATNLLWTTYSTWNHGVSSSIRTCVQRTFKRKTRDNIELTDMSTKRRSKPEEKPKKNEPVQTVSYLETHF